jgi:hypothetical protein
MHITPKLSFEIEIILDDMTNDLIGDFQPFIDVRKSLNEDVRKANIIIEYEVKIKADYIAKIEALKEDCSSGNHKPEAIFRNISIYCLKHNSEEG